MMRHVPNHFKTQEMCNKAFEKNPWVLADIPNHFKTEEMRKNAVDRSPWFLADVPNHFKHKKCATKQFKGNQKPYN